MADWVASKEAESMSERVREFLTIYREEAFELVEEIDYENFKLMHYMGDVWDVVVLCQREGEHMDRYEPQPWEAWEEVGKGIADSIMESARQAKANQGKRHSPRDYDDILI